MPPIKIILLIFLCFQVANSALAGDKPLPILMLPETVTSASLAGHLDIFEDPTGQLTINDVRSPEIAGRFQPDKRSVPHFGATSSIFWVRFSIVTPSDKEIERLLELDAPLMDYIDFYSPSPTGSYDQMQAGELRPISQRKFRHINPVFPLSIKSTVKTYYLRIDSRGWIKIPLTIRTPNAFVTNESRRGLFDGGYFGAMLVMVIYSLFIFISLRDKTYLYYSLDIFGFALYVFSIKGLLIGFVSEDALWLNNYNAVIVLIPLISSLLFCRSFLDTAKHTPLIDKILKLFLCIACLMGPAYFLLPLNVIRHTQTIISFLASLTALIAGITCIIRGNQLARYFVVARIFRIAGVLSYSLSLLLPVHLPTLVGLQIGSMIDVVILAFALANRIRMMQREKEDLQTEAIRASQLSTLGELAAGVAHEINTPLNTIINSADLILENKDRKETEQDVEMIKTQGRRIATITKSLLFYSRQPEKEKAPFSVVELLQGALDLVGAHIRREQICLSEKIPNNLPRVTVHPQQIEQVFLNVLTNAMHALAERHKDTPENKSLTIEASEVFKKNTPFVRISFLDNGIGIADALINKVTQSFMTTKQSGAGLGLSISRKIIEEHGGTIKLESRPGDHTRVMIDLPATLNN